MPKYWGATKFLPQEFLRRGSKAIDVERKREESESEVITIVSL